VRDRPLRRPYNPFQLHPALDTARAICATSMACSLSRSVRDCPETLHAYSCSRGEVAGSQRAGTHGLRKWVNLCRTKSALDIHPASAAEIHRHVLPRSVHTESAYGVRSSSNFLLSPLATHHRERRPGYAKQGSFIAYRRFVPVSRDNRSNGGESTLDTAPSVQYTRY
jgi:hypothetical protein